MHVLDVPLEVAVPVVDLSLSPVQGRLVFIIEDTL